MEIKTKETMRKLKAVLKKRLGDESKDQFFMIDLLESYINLYYEAKECISKEGICFQNKYGIIQKHPAVAILQTSSKHIQSLLKTLLLTPTKESVLNYEEEEFLKSLTS